MFGKTKSYGNNQAGADSIGSVALPNLYLSVLGELGIEVPKNKVRGVELGHIINIDGIKLK